jgi:hypothetical protein
MVSIFIINELTNQGFKESPHSGLSVRLDKGWVRQKPG